MKILEFCLDIRKTTFLIATIVLLTSQAYGKGESDGTAMYAQALRQSDFVFICKVTGERLPTHGDHRVQKSYRVTYPDTLYISLVGLNLPGELWIHYDSSRYPDVPKSGFESTFQKGDPFIAFLDYVSQGEPALRIVRLDKLNKREEIKAAIKDYRIKYFSGTAPAAPLTEALFRRPN